MPRRGLWRTVVVYLVSVAALATAPQFAQQPYVSFLSTPAVAVVILLGAYWAFVKIRPRTIGRVIVVLVTLVMFGPSVALVSQADPIGTQSRSPNAGNLTLQEVRDYARNCFLAVGINNSHSSSGYFGVSYGGAFASTDGDCTGVGHISTLSYASGVYGWGNARSLLSFADAGIFPAPGSNGQHYNLVVVLDYLVNGWQTSHSVGLPAASSSASLDVDFQIVDEQGLIFSDSVKSWDGTQTVGSGEIQYSYNLELPAGHIYSAVLKFTETSSVWVAGVAGVASATGCFTYNNACPNDPLDDAAVGFYCPYEAGTIAGHCQDVQWRSMTFSMKAY